MNRSVPMIGGDEALRSAAGLDPAAPAAFAKADLLRPPVFETVFRCPMVPELEGLVAIRYPRFGDLLEIERITGLRGGGAVAEWYATLSVCLEQAPDAWFRVVKDQRLPVLALDTFPDGDGLQLMLREFLAWRRSVRGGSLRGDSDRG